MLSEVGETRFPANGGPAPDAAQFNQRVKAYEAATTTLTAMAIEAGRWAEADHQEVWVRALQRVAANRSAGGGFPVWLDLQGFPAMLLLYSLALTAVQSNRLDFLRRLLTWEVSREDREDKLAVHLLQSGCLFKDGRITLFEGKESRLHPVSDWLCDWLEPATRRLFHSKQGFEFEFDRLEVLMALSYGQRSSRSAEWYWVPVGGFGYRHGNRSRVIEMIEASLEESGASSPYVQAKLFGATVDECQAQLAQFKKFAAGIRPW